jgi:transposase
MIKISYSGYRFPPDIIQHAIWLYVRLDVDGQTCTCCGGALHAIGESVSEILDWETVPLGDDRASQPQRLKQDARFVGCSTGG